MEEYTDGRYAVDVYTNAALGSGSQLTSTEMTQKGTIDMVLTSTAILSNMDGNFYAFDMPWLVEDLDWVDENLVAGSKLLPAKRLRGLASNCWPSPSWATVSSPTASAPLRLPPTWPA